MEASSHFFRVAVASDLHAFAQQPEGMESPSKLRVPTGTPSPVEMTALWQKDRITGRLIRVIVEIFIQSLAGGALEHEG